MSPSNNSSSNSNSNRSNSTSTAHTDWRIKLLGESILLNPKTDDNQDDSFTLTKSVPTAQALEGYDYIALFFGANYCPYCRNFAPVVAQARELLESKKNCKVIFVSNDSDQANFDEFCRKIRGIDAMQYNTVKTAVMRRLFGLRTIPALMILSNKPDDLSSPRIYSNARNILESDPQAKNFPWGSPEQKTIIKTPKSRPVHVSQ